MPLNNVGDFLAGAFGPIAFFWLILGFMQQGIELRLSADALKMQADELRASVEQQTALVAAQEHSLRNHERSLEPLLQLKYLGQEREDGAVFEKFSIINLGAYCESVAVELNDDRGEVEVSVELEPLHNNDAHDFVISEIEGRYCVRELVVKYKKISGSSSFQVFELTKYNMDEFPGIWIRKRPLQG
ncbi:hypothetical protein [Pseudomonas fluorescens]|uniref:hypothetical protein n=1 Tax=Pseudomonas fluorescens TaxID=294 RepID=UPI0004BE3542|nr:hypothetical protein [Pseudomonas fluorescens]